MTDISIKKLIESKQPIYIISKTINSDDVKERYGDHVSVVDLLDQELMEFVSINTSYNLLKLRSIYKDPFYLIVNEVNYEINNGDILDIHLHQEPFDDFMNNWYNKGKY